MAQKISQGSIFGRIGSGLGRGLAEQLPKEIERGRLSAGLKELGNQKGLDQFERFTGLASIPGALEHPQLLQTAGELLKQRQIRDAYKRGTPQQNQSFSDLSQVQPFNAQSQQTEQPIRSGKIESRGAGNQTIPSNQNAQESAYSNPPAANENPLDEKFIPVDPWNQARDEQAINEAFDRGLATTLPEARAYADSQREIYEKAPEKYREQLDYKKGIDQQVDNLFDKQLQTRLQKEGKETFADIPGDLQLKIKKKARNSVATGKMTPEQAAEFYSTKALNLAKSKGQALKIANRDILDRLIPVRKEETLKNVSQVAKKYSEMGADEDFYNFLTSNATDENGKQLGMGLSPGGAAIIQYPRTEKVKSLTKNTKISSKNPAESTRAFAEDLFKIITPEDSFLAIARQMKQQDPNFDEYAFFDYLRENRDQYGSIDRLDREVVNGVSDFFPNWRDIGLFPAFGKAVTND